jgi:hypothetical protein
MGDHIRAGDLDIWTEQVGRGPDVLLIGGAGGTVESWQVQLDGLMDRLFVSSMVVIGPVSLAIGSHLLQWQCYPVCTPTPVTPGRVHWGTGRPPFLGPIGAPCSSVRKKEWVGNCGHPSGESSHSSRRP